MYGTLLGSLPYGAAALASAVASAAQLNVTILSPYDSDLATMAASSQVSTLPVSNLQSLQPGKVWRTDGVTEAYISVAFAGPVAANGLALVGHNLSALGVYRVRLADSAANTTAAPAVDTGWQSVWPTTGKPVDANWPRYLSFLSWSNDALYSYARVDIADPSPLKTYLQVGRLMLGRYWRPTANFSISGIPLGFDQRDTQTLTEYGGTFTDRRSASAPRIFQVAISAADRDEVMVGIADINRLAGMWGDVACLLDPSATTHFHRHSMQAVFATQQRHQMVPLFTSAGEGWTVELNLREVI